MALQGFDLGAGRKPLRICLMPRSAALSISLLGSIKGAAAAGAERAALASFSRWRRIDLSIAQVVLSARWLNIGKAAGIAPTSTRR